MTTRTPLEQRPEDIGGASPEGLPEKLGRLIGAILFVGICALIAWPLVRHLLVRI
jgi:hypothetical protein